jgi:hypothetical protein
MSRFVLFNPYCPVLGDKTVSTRTICPLSRSSDMPHFVTIRTLCPNPLCPQCRSCHSLHPLSAWAPRCPGLHPLSRNVRIHIVRYVPLLTSNVCTSNVCTPGMCYLIPIVRYVRVHFVLPYPLCPCPICPSCHPLHHMSVVQRVLLCTIRTICPISHMSTYSPICPICPCPLCPPMYHMSVSV